MRVTASVTLHWTTHAPEVIDTADRDERTSQRDARSPSAADLNATADNEEIFLVSEAAIRVPSASMCCARPEADAARIRSAEGITPTAPMAAPRGHPSLHSLVWLTVCHSLQKIELEVTDDAHDGAGRSRMLTLPRAFYTAEAYHGLVQPLTQGRTSPASSRSASPRDGQEDEEEAAVDVTGHAAHPIEDAIATAARVSSSSPPLHTCSMRSANPGHTSADPLVLTLDFGVDSVEVDAPHVQTAMHGDEELYAGEDDVLKLSLEDNEDDEDDKDDEEGRHSHRDVEQPQRVSLGVKRDREDDGAIPHDGAFHHCPSTRKEHVPGEQEAAMATTSSDRHATTAVAFTNTLVDEKQSVVRVTDGPVELPRPPSTAVDSSHPRRLRLFLGSAVSPPTPPPAPTTAPIQSDVSRSPMECTVTDVKNEDASQTIKRANVDEAGAALEAPHMFPSTRPQAARTLSLRSGLVASTKSETFASAPPPRRLRLTTAQSTLPPPEETSRAKDEVVESTQGAGVDGRLSLTDEDGDRDEGDEDEDKSTMRDANKTIPSLPASQTTWPLLISISPPTAAPSCVSASRCHALSPDEETRDDEDDGRVRQCESHDAWVLAETFFTQEEWPDKVIAAVLHFTSPSTLPDEAALEAWKSLELTRLLCRPRTAPRTTRAELQDGPSLRHFYGLGHTRLSSAVCPHVSPLHSLTRAPQTDVRPTEQCTGKAQMAIQDTVLDVEPHAETPTDVAAIPTHRRVAPPAPLAVPTAVTVQGPAEEPLLNPDLAASTAPLLLTASRSRYENGEDGGDTDDALARTSVEQSASFTTSTTHTHLTLIGDRSGEGQGSDEARLPLIASQLRFLLRLHTVVHRVVRAGDGASAEGRSMRDEQRLAPIGAALADTTAHTAASSSPLSIPPCAPSAETPLNAAPSLSTRIETITLQGLDWSVREYLDGNTWEFTPQAPSSVVGVGRVCGAERHLTYIVCDPSLAPVDAVTQQLAPLHFLLRHIQAWWSSHTPTQLSGAALTAHAGEEQSGVSADVRTAHTCVVLVCDATNWALDTSRGAQATPEGITLSVALVQSAVASVRSWRDPPCPPSHTRPIDARAIKALTTLTSVMIEHHLLQSRASLKSLGHQQKKLLWATQSARALGYAYSLSHLPRSVQTLTTVISEAVPPGTASSAKGLTPDQRDGLTRMTLPAQTLAARLNIQRDQRRLMQWCQATSALSPASMAPSRTTSPAVTPASRLPAALQDVLFASAWRAPFVGDYFTSTALGIVGLSHSFSLASSPSVRMPRLHLVHLRTTTDEVPDTSAPLVSVQLSADVHIFDSKTLHAVRASAAEVARITLPLMGLVFSVERQTDGSRGDVNALEALAATLCCAEESQPHAAAVPCRFRLSLCEAAPITWRLHNPRARDELALPSLSGSRTSPHTLTADTCDGAPFLQQVVLPNPYARDAGDPSTTTLESLLSNAGAPTKKGAASAKSKASKSSARGPAQSGAHHYSDVGDSDGLTDVIADNLGGNDSKNERSHDGDEDDFMDGADSAGGNGTSDVDNDADAWELIALIPVVTPYTSPALHSDTYANTTYTCLTSSSFCRTVEEAARAQACRYVASLVPPPDGGDAATWDTPDDGSRRRRGRKPSKKASTRQRRQGALAAFEAARQAAMDQWGAPLAAHWCRLLVSHLVGHTLLSDHFATLLFNLKGEVEARADCLPTVADDATVGPHGVCTGLHVLHRNVPDAYRNILQTIASDRVQSPASRPSQNREQTLSAPCHPTGSIPDALLWHVRHPARLDAAVSSAAESVLKQTCIEDLRAATMHHVALANISLARWRARFHVKAELKRAPAPRSPLVVDLSPLIALARRHGRRCTPENAATALQLGRREKETNRVDEACVDDGLPTCAEWLQALRANVFLS